MDDDGGESGAGGVRVRAEDPGTAVGRRLRRAYWADVAALIGIELDRTGDGLPAGDETALVAPHGIFLVAWRDGHPLGCVGARRLEPQVYEVKRLYVDPAARGLRVGARLLTAVEDWSRDRGARLVRLDTRTELVAARRLYAAAGYVEVEPYNDNPDAQLWFEKTLA